MFRLVLKLIFGKFLRYFALSNQSGILLKTAQKIRHFDFKR